MSFEKWKCSRRRCGKKSYLSDMKIGEVKRIPGGKPYYSVRNCILKRIEKWNEEYSYEKQLDGSYLIKRDC